MANDFAPDKAKFLQEWQAPLFQGSLTKYGTKGTARERLG